MTSGLEPANIFPVENGLGFIDNAIDCIYSLSMEITFDADKNAKNIRERGLSFERVMEFDFETAVIEQDARKAYPEDRYIAAGFLDGRLHVLCFTPAMEGIRVISFRKANQREVKRYEQK